MRPRKEKNVIEWNKANQAWEAPGLIDIQINGINGVNFNEPSLKKEDLLQAANYLLSKGITTFFPTIITNSEENILAILQTIHQACLFFPRVDTCVGGIHLEGPFISPEEGARGAHKEEYVKDPDWGLFQKFQDASGERIKLITIAPEAKGSVEFIKACSARGIMVSMGHSLANTSQINAAVKAGLRLSTHLGNGIPLILKRHPNPLWDQLAQDEIYASIITDGSHLPDSFIKTVIKVKGDRTILISDALYLAGFPPGEYETPESGPVILDDEKRIEMKDSPGLLAGSAKDLLENVETLVAHGLVFLDEAWGMASINPLALLARYDAAFRGENKDRVHFSINGNKIQIEETIKNGEVVFKN